MGDAAASGADSGASSGGGGMSMASGASIASLGLSAFGSISKGYGTQQSDEMQADRLHTAAEFGRVQATLTDTTYRENLNTTLGNIDAIRAAGRIDPTSPTTAVLQDHATELSDRQRLASVVSQRSQADEEDASASYLHAAGDYAVTQGYIGAGLDVLKGVAQVAVL